MLKRLTVIAGVALVLTVGVWWALSQIIARAAESDPDSLITIICTVVLGKPELGACEHPTRLLPRIDVSCLQNLKVQEYLLSIRKLVSADLEDSLTGTIILEFPNYRRDPLICADIPRFRATETEKRFAKLIIGVPPAPRMKADHECLLGRSVEISIGSDLLIHFAPPSVGNEGSG